VQLTAFRPSGNGGYIVRLFESAGSRRTARIKLSFCGAEKQISLNAFEIKTLRIGTDGSICECGLLE